MIESVRPKPGMTASKYVAAAWEREMRPCCWGTSG
jgi:hypothetical protein